MKLRFHGLAALAVVLLLFWFARARTGERGPDVAGAAPPGPVRDEAPSDPFVPAPVTTRQALESTPASATPEVAPPALARLFGTFTEAGSARPLAGLELGVFDALGERSARTSVEGEYSFPLRAGAWTFYLRASPGRMARVEELVLAPGEERELSGALGEAGTLCVRVWRAEEGEATPLEGASVWLIEGDSPSLAREDWPRALRMEPVLTDRDGRAELPFADFAAVVLLVRAEGCLPWSGTLDFSPFLSWLPFSSDGCVNVALSEASRSVRGIVLAPDGRPLEGALVALLEPDTRAPRVRTFSRTFGEGTVELQPAGFPCHVRTGAGGHFTLTLPDALAREAPRATLIVCPGRTELVHHFVHPLTPGELLGQASTEIRLPAAGEVELEFVDATGASREGMASVRDADGVGHGGDSAFNSLDVDPTGAGRRLPTRAGRVRLRHPGGAVRVGLSPEGKWDARELAVDLPPGEGLRHVRIVIP